MELDQLKVIITGGASGLGEHFAKQLLAAGAQVTVGDVNEEGLAALPEGIHRRRLNVADQDEIASFVPWAAEQMGGLNSLINNAGIIRDGLWVGKSRKTGEIRRMSRQDWDLVIAINLTGAAFMVQEVVAHMIDHDEPGVIVNISSIARHGNRGQDQLRGCKSSACRKHAHLDEGVRSVRHPRRRRRAWRYRDIDDGQHESEGARHDSRFGAARPDGAARRPSGAP